eukprot:1157667-Pelagomonas_calceolata.AAC.6
MFPVSSQGCGLGSGKLFFAILSFLLMVCLALIGKRTNGTMGQRDVQPVSSCGRLVDPGEVAKQQLQELLACSRGEHGQASEPEENNTSWDEDSSPGGFEEASQPHETAPKGREEMRVIFTPETLHSGGYHAQSLSSSAEIPVKAFVLGRPTPRGWNEPYTSEKNWVNVERRRVKKQDYVTKTNQLVSVKEWNCLKAFIPSLSDSCQVYVHFQRAWTRSITWKENVCMIYANPLSAGYNKSWGNLICLEHDPILRNSIFCQWSGNPILVMSCLLPASPPLPNLDIPPVTSSGS